MRQHLNKLEIHGLTYRQTYRHLAVLLQPYVESRMVRIVIRIIRIVTKVVVRMVRMFMIVTRIVRRVLIMVKIVNKMVRKVASINFNVG